MHTLTLSVSEDAVEQMSHWLQNLYLTGNLTRDDPARMFAGVIVKALKTEVPKLTIILDDLTN